MAATRLSYMEDTTQAQFSALSAELICLFPEIDLRFSLQSGENTFRYMLPEFSDDIFEIELGIYETEELLYEAVFTIKEIAQLFDA